MFEHPQLQATEWCPRRRRERPADAAPRGLFPLPCPQYLAVARAPESLPACLRIDSTQLAPRLFVEMPQQQFKNSTACQLLDAMTQLPLQLVFTPKTRTQYSPVLCGDPISKRNYATLSNRSSDPRRRRLSTLVGLGCPEGPAAPFLLVRSMI
jgi:hypothetical protein